MWKAILFSVGVALLPGVAGAQTTGGQSLASDVASMREDLRILSQRVGELSLTIEQLQRDNAALRAQTASSSQAYATVQQLNDAVTDLNHAIKAGDAAVSERVAAQIKKLGEATNAALDSLAKGQAQRTPVQTTFSDNFPSEGVSYTVQKGDTLAVIARKTGGKTQDIINANKIADPSKIMVGQTLFIPGGK
jgi:LysM repeat protein